MPLRFGDDVSRGDAEVRVELLMGSGRAEAGHADEAAARGEPGVPAEAHRRLDAPLGVDGPKVQGYTLNLLKSRAELPKIASFQHWLFKELERQQPD